jgi:urea transport system ATP-binding protein
MISVRKATVHYGVAPVLRSIDLEVGPGEMLAVLGPNGVGKTTLLHLIAGIMPLAEGDVSIGEMVRRSSQSAEATIRRNVCFLPNESWLPSRLTGREYALAVAELYQRPMLEAMDQVQGLFELFHLEKQADNAISKLSTG